MHASTEPGSNKQMSLRQLAGKNSSVIQSFAKGGAKQLQACSICPD
jgi:hypothetical protein